MSHKHTNMSSPCPTQLLEIQGLRLFYPSTNELFEFWKTDDALPSKRSVPCFSFTKRSSNSHLVTLRISYYIQGSRLSVTDISEKGPPTTVQENPPSNQGGVLRASLFSVLHLQSLRPNTEHFNLWTTRKKTGQNYSPLTWPLKHMVFCPDRQTDHRVHLQLGITPTTIGPL